MLHVCDVMCPYECAISPYLYKYELVVYSCIYTDQQKKMHAQVKI